MLLRLSIAFLSLSLISAELKPCEPPIPNCLCDSKLLQCTTGCSEIPQQVPTTIEDFIFDGCKFANPISSIPYPNAKTLSIVNSDSLDLQDGAFSQMAALATLQLNGNKLLALRREMFQGLSGLTMLELPYNQLQNISAGSFQHLTSLKTLDLTNNNQLFDKFDKEAFLGVESTLSKLVLDVCGFTEIPVEALEDLDQLKELSLFGNALGNVPKKAFEAHEELQVLRLNSCGLSDIHKEAMEGLDKLIELDLSNNALSMLDEDLLEDSRDTLTRLHVQNNKFAYLPEDLVKWNQLSMLLLADNPWACDCRNAWMQVMHLNTKENITCASPPEFAEHDLHTTMQDLSCPTNNKATIVMAVVIPLIIICVLLLAYFVFKLVQTKRRSGDKKNVRYSSVYKDTVETVSGGGGGGKPKSRPMSEL